MTGPRIALGRHEARFALDAVTAGGGAVVPLSDSPDALVWLDETVAGLAEELAKAPSVRWVQLPLAGVEDFVASGLIDRQRLWTCAKGAYGKTVAEHALALMLAGLRHLRTRIGARSWGAPAGTTLYGQRIAILGGGGITAALLELLAPFRVEATVVRRRLEPVANASHTVSISELNEVLPGSVAVVLALALTPETTGIIGAAELALMDRSAWLINVARGRHVDTEALVAALEEESIGGAALDVTEPEPLPDGHRLWDLPNCIITPHTADTVEMSVPDLVERIRTNVSRFATGQTLVGLVDPETGY